MRTKNNFSIILFNLFILNLIINFGFKDIFSDSLLVPQNLEQDQVQENISEQNSKNPENKKITVRVLLKEELSPDNILWKINLDSENKKNSGFLISSNKTKSRNINSQELIITYRSGYFYINGKKILKDNIIIKPENSLDSNLVLDGTSYQGDFVICKSENKFYLINYLDLESYVSSVLYGESWPGWPIDINEVFAIMCRTYVISKILDVRQKKTKRPYDVKATNHHQTYKGFHKYSNFIQAVDNTQSVVLTYQGNPINAMYDCCCGGIITADSVGQINFKHAPYLKRDYACTHCKDSKIFNWQAEYSIENFIKILSKDYKNIKSIKDIKITRRDKAGIVQEIKIITNNPKNIILSGKKAYNFFKNIKSLLFDVVKTGHKIKFVGQGYGHLMGLCQWGARQMVKDGWGYKQVLRFYYPGTEFMKIKIK